MSGGPLATHLAPRPDLPLRYLLTGPAFYLGAQAALLAAAPQLAAGSWLSWPVAGAAHLLTLGWATMVMMGATFQLVPVLLRAPVASEPLGRLAWWLLWPGASLLSGGLLLGRPSWLPPAAALALAGIAAYAAVMGASLARAPRGPRQRPALAGALAFLVMAAAAGAALALGLARGRFASPLLVTHAAAGLGGWLTLTAFAVAHRLVPMFALAHGYSQRRHTPTLVLAGAGALAAALTPLAPAAGGAGLVLAATAYGLFTWDVVAMVRHRRRRRPELVTRFTVAAVAFALAAVLLVAPAALGGAPDPLRPRLVLAAGYAFLGGWVSLLILGHLLKIVPFLTWLERYAERAAAAPVPLVRDLFAPWLGEAALAGSALGAAVAVAGILAGAAAAVQAGLALTLAGAVAAAAALVQVRWGTPPGRGAAPGGGR